jgi:hypothetical protein
MERMAILTPITAARMATAIGATADIALNAWVWMFSSPVDNAPLMSKPGGVLASTVTDIANIATSVAKKKNIFPFTSFPPSLYCF